MAALSLDALSKAYGSATALAEVSLAIDSGEFFTLLGPSGCGKTTLLRTVAGFIRQDAGRVLIDGRAVDRVPAHRRDTGMVFQDYAVFPHLSVAENVAFGLRNRALGKAQIRERVAQALASARLSDYAARLPHELSGGQQQRVGLARAMVIRPQVLLMDEPLSNLDAKLRLELREEIRDIQRELGITTLYVTHDQEEALAVSDRICVMRDGHVQQTGSAWDIYKHPGTRFVAEFVGSMNVLRPPFGELAGTASATLSTLLARAGAGEVIAAIRPEDVLLPGDGATPDSACLSGEARVLKITFTGREAQLQLRGASGDDYLASVAKPARETLQRTGDNVRTALPLASLLFFDAVSGERVAAED